MDNENEDLGLNQLEGRNAVLEALRSDRQIDKILFKKGEIEGTLKVILAIAKEKKIVVSETSKMKLDEISTTNNHQGVIAYVPSAKYYEVEDILDYAKSKNEPPFVIILDEITDPHNLGAIMRTAEVAGVHGIIIPKRRSVSLTSVVSKTSAGAIEYMRVAKVTNINQTIKQLKDAGLWIACADMDGTDYFKSDLKGALGVVIGNEGSGVSRLVKENCDFKIKIPMYGKISSLNASVAASLIMYEAVRQKHFMI